MDIAILTVESDDMRAIALAKSINYLHPTCQIIFLFSDVSVSAEVYEAEHVWAIQKNNVTQYLERSISKCLKNLSECKTRKPGLFIRENGKTVLIPISEILYISKVGRKSIIKGLFQDHFDARNPAQLIPPLFTDCFLRCHQGYWVNLNMISELDHEEFVLQDGSRVPIGRVFRMDARKRFLQQFSEG